MRRSRQAVSNIFFTNGFLYANYVSRLPDIQEQYALDYKGIGFVLLCGSMGSLLAMPFTGGIITRFGSKNTALCSSFFFGLFVATFMLSPNAAILFAAFFAKGVAAGITDVSMNAQAVVVEKSYKKPIMGALHGIFSLGMFVGAGAGALFIYLDIPVLQHLTTISILGFALVLSMSRHLLVGDQIQKQARKLGSTKFFNIPAPVLVATGIVAFCGMLAEGALAEWSTNYMREVMHSTDFFAPAGLTAFSLAMLVGRFIADRGRIYYGDRKLVTISSIIAIVGIIMTISVLHISIVILGFFLGGLGLAAIVPIAYSKAGNTPGIDPGTGISMVTTIGYSGFIIGPAFIGFLADWQGLRVAYFFVLLLLIVMLILSTRKNAI